MFTYGHAQCGAEVQSSTSCFSIFYCTATDFYQ